MTERESRQGPPNDHRALERHRRDIDKLIADREFESIDALNAFFAEHVNGRVPPAVPAETDAERAQELVYDAWETSSVGLKRKLASDALKIDPDCADALCLLGELEEDPAEARDLFERATEAGERALGDEYFAEHAGRFWSLLDTRGYVRARFALAQVLWDEGRREEAIAHAEGLLELNPSDNQGVRELLVGWLLTVHETRRAARLIRAYEPAESALWLWALTIQRFQAKGPTRAAEDALIEAVDEYPWVWSYLVGVREFPKELPEMYEVGGEDEAVLAAWLLAEAWDATAGIAEWTAHAVRDDDISAHWAFGGPVG